MPKKPPRNNPRDGDRRTLQSSASLLQRITAKAGSPRAALPLAGSTSLIEQVRKSLPEELRQHLVEVLEKPGELVLFADSAVWAGRLKLAVPELSGVLAGRRQTVRVMLPGASGRKEQSRHFK